MKRDSGQALVEFSLAIIVLLVLAMGVLDFGQAIYRYNAVSQAAREIARVASVHPGSPLGTDPAVAGVIATQKGLVPGLTVTSVSCVDNSGTVANPCDYATDNVRVAVSAPYSPVTPIIALIGTWTMQGSSTEQIQ